MSQLASPSAASPQANTNEPVVLAEALDWLHSAPGGAQPHTSKDEPLLDLLPLRKHLKAVGALHLEPVVLLKILDLFEARVISIHEILMPLLLDAALSLPRHLRIVSRGLIDVHGELAQCLLQVAKRGSEQAQASEEVPAVAARALRQLEQQYIISLHIFSAMPHALWRDVLALLHLSRQALASSRGGENPLETTLKRMLATAAAQADSLTPRELSFLLDYLRVHAPAILLSDELPEQADHSWYWFDDSGEHAPTAAARRPPDEAGNRRLYFSCSQLAQLAEKQLALLKTGITPLALSLPPQVISPDYLNALQHAMRHWSNPPPRARLRKRSNYRVQLCVHPGKLWYLLQGKPPPGGDDDDQVASEWMILNETPTGFSAMHVNGTIRSLLAGTTVGLRINEEAPWSICLVRWARSDNPEHIELGLEAIAPSAQAVRILSAGDTPLPALLLPALAATQRSEAILSANSKPLEGKFTLVLEDEDKLQVVECETTAQVERTASISIHEFRRIALRS